MRLRRTTHVSESDDRRRRGRTSETSWQSSARYDGAWPVRHWTTRTAIWNRTRCRTGNQWSCRRVGKMWSQCRTPDMSHAAAFWTDCRRRIRPSATTLSMSLHYCCNLQKIQKSIIFDKKMKHFLS